MSRCRHAAHPLAPPESPGPERRRLTLAWQEPFRLFFPWGMVVGVAGVLLWPMFFAGWLRFYPNVLHARWMILGWGGAMVVGFLATAGPRMLGVPRLTFGEVRMLFMVHAASVAAFYFAGEASGCGLFAALLVLLVLMLGHRFGRRTDLPPPRFALVMLGLLCGATGSAMIAAGWDLRGGAFTFRLARLLMDEAFLLLPILGIGGFLVPRITGLPPRRPPEEGRLPTPDWVRQAMESLFLGLLVVVTFVLEAAGQMGLAMAGRIGIIGTVWMLDFPRLWVVRVAGTQAWMLRLALLAMPVAWLARWIDPPRLYAVEHILFMTGFGVLMFAAASRVADGHSGNRAAATGRSRPLRWLFWLALLAMLTRLSGDYFIQVQRSHYIYAAILWAAVMAIWLACFWRKLGTPDPEGDE